MAKTGICKGCGAEISWMKTILGKPMPVNPDQTIADGRMNLILILENGVVVRSPQAGTIGHVPHWGTCTSADRFKKTSAEASK